MKKSLLLLALFLIQVVTAQENITLDDLLRNGDPNRPTTPIIYQRSVGVTDLPSFNTKINTANHKYFEQAIAELFSASNKQLFINYTTLRAYVAEYEEIPNLVSVGIINAQYDLLNYDMRNPSNPNNGFIFTGDKLIPIKGKQEFIKMHTTVISPLKKYVIGSTVLFKFDEILVFSYGTKRINTLSTDLGDGVFRTIINDGNIVLSKINIPITRSRELKQTYKIIFSDNTTLITYSTIYAKNPNQSLRRKSTSNHTLDVTLTSDYAFRGYDEPQALNGVLDYRVFYADANTSRRLRKPIIILDGFDPGDERQIEETDYMVPNSDDNKPSIYELMNYGSNQNLVENLKTKGYDVVIVNFPGGKVIKPWLPSSYVLTPTTGEPSLFIRVPRSSRCVDGGGDYIERNALTVVTLLQKLNREIRGNGSTEKLVVMGPSMGGLISRYALAYMEKELAKNPNNTAHKQKWNHNTRLWVSMDSPHLGANIPIGVQALLYLMADAGIVAGTDFYNNNLKSVAAKQMLINQHRERGSYRNINNSYMNSRVTEQGFLTNSGAPFYQRFYRALYNNGLPNSKGYPINVDRKIAIANGSMAGTTIGSNSQQTTNIREFGWFGLHLLSSETYTLPSRGRSASRIARFKKPFCDKNTTAASYDTRGSLDILSGGFYDSYDQIVNAILDVCPGASARTNTRIHGFIPTFSALAIKNPNVNWSSGINQNLVTANKTPFDTYYGESTNTRHVSFTQASKNWLFKELDSINQSPVPNYDFDIRSQTRAKSNETLSPDNQDKVKTIEQGQNNFLVYPNPSKGKFTVTYNFKRNSKYKIHIYNSLGKIVRVENVSLEKPVINLYPIINGIYYLRLFNDNIEVETTKLLIKK